MGNSDQDTRSRVVEYYAGILASVLTLAGLIGGITSVVLNVVVGANALLVPTFFTSILLWAVGVGIGLLVANRRMHRFNQSTEIKEAVRQSRRFFVVGLLLSVLPIAWYSISGLVLSKSAMDSLFFDLPPLTLLAVGIGLVLYSQFVRWRAMTS